MLRLTLKNLAANRVRFALTTSAVVLAVAFVVSSFVLTDGLRSSFGDLSEEIVAGTDLQVRPVDEFGNSALITQDLVDEVGAIDGVEVAAPFIEGPDNAVLPLRDDGTQIGAEGPPQIAFSWVDSELSPFSIVEGDAPEMGEFTVDLDSAAEHGFVIGERYDVLTPSGRINLEMSGTTSFGSDNDTLGATLIHLDLNELEQAILQDGYDSIEIALADGADRSTVERAVGNVLPTSAEVIDQATLEAEQKDEFNSNIDVIGNVMLGFAGVSLFVSVFIIYNTFAIVLSQRTRELALLRTVGADPKQLRRSVMGESLGIGIIASIIGVGAGIGVALGLRALADALGFGLPDSPVIISGRTIIVAAIVGIGVTLLSAVGPARKASRVPAIAALRDGADAAEGSSRRRIAIGAVMLAAGLGLVGLGLFSGGSTGSVVSMLAIGAMTVFIAITVLGPLFAGPLTRALGWPVGKSMGVSGRLASENAGRNPRRTSTTAAALMIGLALVSMALVVGESVKAQLRSTLDSSVKAEYLVTEDFTDTGFPAELAASIDALPETDVVTTFNYEDVLIGTELTEVVATDHENMAALFDLGFTEGVAFDTTVVDPVLVSDDEAAALGLSVGDTVAAEWSNGQTRDLEIIGIFTDDVIMEEKYIVDTSTWDAVGADQMDYWIALSTIDGISTADIDAAFAPIAADYPQALIDTFGEFVERLEGFVDSALAALNVMVALAVIIALIGIANTLALSVFERTRELGLLRAVGMTRRQMRRMVRFEAGLVALFGAVLGVAVGIAFGWATVVALPASVTSTLAIPVNRIVVLVIVAGVAGLLAAWGPARRASRMNVLDAISS